MGDFEINKKAILIYCESVKVFSFLHFLLIF